jgi:MFS family permease
MLSGSLFQNGFYLNYFTKMGISSAAFAMLQALPALLSVFLLIPFAFYSDRFGKKKLALIGQLLLITSLVLMMSAGWWGNQFSKEIIIAALLVACVGGSLQSASWFALLNPIIPKDIRGRFFGRLRVIFQSVSILFALLVTQVFKASETMRVFQILLGVVLVASVLRFFTYARIPELENAAGESDHRLPLIKALRSVLAVPGYIQFNGYIFLITLFTAAVPTVFFLMQKDIFGFTASQISFVGTWVIVGGVIGCGLGGRVVDRHGVRFVFRVTHVAYAVVMLTMLARHWVPWSLLVHTVGCVWAFSLVAGVAGVAATSQTLELIPAANKSLSTAVTISLVCAAMAFAGMFVSSAISWETLSPSWQLLGQSYTAYDSLLLAFASLTLLMLVTIGLIPKVVKKK